MSPIWIVLIVTSSVMLLLLCGAYYCYRVTFYTNRKKHYDPERIMKKKPDEIHRKARELLEKFTKIPYEPVKIKSHDGLTLTARYYHTADGAPLEICFNGYRSRVERDFAGGGAEALAMGHNLLLVNQRSHSDSEGRTITFGAKERLDVLSWVEYSVSRFGGDVRIILVGVSMGAATVLLSSDADFGGCVRGIVADCPYDSAKGIIKEVMRRDMKLPATLLYPLVWLGAVIFGGFTPSDAEVVKHTKNTKIPVLLIHGEGDSFVPIEMSEKIAESNPLIRFHRFKDAGHVESYLYDAARYREIYKDFCDEVTSK